jgi:transcriptional regulator with GAF, ATPase, and Fis domain
MRRKLVLSEEKIRPESKKAKKARMDIVRSVVKQLPVGVTLNDLKYAFIERVLERQVWNRTAAANELGLNYSTVMTMIRSGLVATGVRRNGRPPDKIRGK